MLYFVTFDEFDANGRPLAAGIDPGMPFSDACAHAYRLLDEGRHNVTIRNDAGKSISGDELAACYRGDKKMTADLQAVAP
jgi:hypothetical protein